MCLPTHPDCSRFPRADTQPQPCQQWIMSTWLPIQAIFSGPRDAPARWSLSGIRIVVGAAKRGPLTGRITSLPRTGQEYGLSQRRADPVTHVSLFSVERDALVSWQRYKSLGAFRCVLNVFGKWQVTVPYFQQYTPSQQYIFPDALIKIKHSALFAKAAGPCCPGLGVEQSRRVTTH